MKIALFNTLKSKLLSVIFTCVMLELFLGGTGRLTEINSFLTLRMCLFLLYMALILVYLLMGRKLPKFVVFIILFFFFLCIFSSLIGYLNGAEPSAIFEDIKPLLNIFLLFYFAFSINSEEDVSYLIKLLKISSVLLIVLHIILYVIYLKLGDITYLYATLSPDDGNSPMFVFRGDGGYVYYFGDIFLCITFLVCGEYQKKSIYKYLLMFFLMVAILITGTRGFLVSLALCYFVKWVILRFNYRSLIYLSIGVIIFLGAFLQLKSTVGDKDESDQTRIEQIKEVKERITPLSAIIGHGYGIGVPIRPIHMEISYLEVFHKQGIVGLLYYLTILLVSYLSFKNCTFENGIGFYLSIIFVFFISGTNPYINHPLGITIISFAIVAMLKIGVLEKTKKITIN
jgi:hypothetical protein